MVTESLTPVPLPQNVAARLLEFVRLRSSGSVTLHLDAGKILKVEVRECFKAS
jgi:hypothetical protein